jgi:hypothetical protein
MRPRTVYKLDDFADSVVEIICSIENELRYLDDVGPCNSV